MPDGMHGRLLRVDLSSGAWRIEDLPEEIFARFLGGRGLGAHLLLTNSPAGADPLGPENPLIFAVGPAAGTRLMGSSRYGVFARSPLTGFFGESYSGGRTAAAVKRAGFDAVVIEGRAAAPVYLEVFPEGARVRPAEHLWGLDTVQTQDALLREVGARNAWAAVIGPAGEKAGEKMVRFALIENDYWRSAGCTGLGAVMGAKKLKGVVFWGDRQARPADPGLLDALARRLLERARSDPAAERYRACGTPHMVAVANRLGFFPARYWSAPVPSSTGRTSPRGPCPRFSRCGGGRARGAISPAPSSAG